jgi:hypothetical protein
VRAPHLRLGGICLLALGCGGAAPLAVDETASNKTISASAEVRAPVPANETVEAAELERSDQAVMAAFMGTASPELLVYDLNRHTVRWRRKIRAETRPEIVGDLVLTVSDGELLALRLTDGTTRWTAAVGKGLKYLGAARTGNRLVFAAASEHSGVKQGDSEITALDYDTGKKLWAKRTEGRLGSPAARDSNVYVPWDWQNLIVLNVADGKERTRHRSSTDLISWVKTDAAGLSFGHQSIFQSSTNAASISARHRFSLPWAWAKSKVVPSLRESAYDPRPASRSARGRIQVFFELEPRDDGVISTIDRRFYFAFYRYIFAFSENGELQWCSILDHDLIDGQSIAGGLLTVEEDGLVSFWDATSGQVRFRTATISPLASATFEAQGIKRVAESNRDVATEASANLAASSGAVRLANTDRPNTFARTGLARVIADPDNRLVQARVFAVQRLAELPDAEATLDLLDLYDNQYQAELVRRAIAESLRSRKSGSDYLIRALDRHGDYLAGTQPPPLSVIAGALASIGERRATGPLISHLFDPDTPLADLASVVSALVTLCDPASREPMRDFLRVYRADSSLQNDPRALTLAAQGLYRWGAPTDRELLATLAADPRTVGELRTAIDALTKPTPPKAVTATPVGLPQKTVSSKRLTPLQIASVFVQHQTELKSCIAAELTRNATLNQVRLVFIVTANGSAYGLKTLPDNAVLGECLAKVIMTWNFPSSTHQRQMVDHLFSVPPELKAASSVAPEMGASVKVDQSASPPKRQWWYWYARQGNPFYQPALNQKPWWAQTDDREPKEVENPWWLPVVSPSNVRASDAAEPSRPLVKKDIVGPASDQSPDRSKPSKDAGPLQPAPQQDRWWQPVEK